jgi:hypothetical protein
MYKYIYIPSEIVPKKTCYVQKHGFTPRILGFPSYHHNRTTPSAKILPVEMEYLCTVVGGGTGLLKNDRKRTSSG